MAHWTWGLAGVFLALPALATPVGTTADTRPAAPQQRQKWQEGGVNLRLSGTYLQGNVNLMTLDLGGGWNLNSGPHQFFADGGGLINKSGDTLSVSRVSGSLMYAYGILDNFNLYGYTTHSHDPSTKLGYRLTTGLGACLHKILAPDFSLFLVSLGPVWEAEWRSGGAQATAWRVAMRANAVKPLTDVLELGADTFWMPSLTDFGDSRLYAEGYLKVKLSEVFSLKISAADEYNTRPQPNVQNNDLGVFLTLMAEWGR